MLLIDIGNSAIKVGQVFARRLEKVTAYAIAGQNVKTIVEDIISNQSGKIMIANTNKTPNLESSLPLHSDITFIKSVRASKGLTNGYKNHQQLGIDRWLNMLYAWSGVNNACCVISCGTCITYDQIDANGQHLGGLILPGSSLSKKSLENLLGIKAKTCKSTTLGLDTQSALGCGIRFFESGLIENLLEYFKTTNPDISSHENIFITGGNAKLYTRNLKTKINLVDNMVLLGMLQTAY